MTDLEVYRQPAADVAIPANAALAAAAAPDLDGWVAVVAEVSRLADAICNTDFVPKAYRGNAPATMAAILAGRELGLPPMTALRHMQVVEGSPSLSAEYKRARVLAAGHEFDVIVRTTEKCVVSGRRRGSTKPPLVVEFTMADARRAGLVKDRGGYDRRPRRMLFARASTELCDTLFSDVTNGLPTTELLTSEEDGDNLGGYDERPATPARLTAADIIGQQAPQTASPAATAPRAPETQPAPPAERAAGEAPTPPLPGEDEPSAEPDDTTYDTPGTVTKPQLTKLAVLFGELGFARDEREQRLVAASQIVGRELESSSDLSRNEAKTLIDTLERCGGDREKLIALLAAGEAPDAS